ncbi:hypothetical protein GCM10007857_77980 [Bradyrhizobium iriomotense]|uniref:Uncharacterized protein n=1 Tax=Bradyrhizobium iriomotense TaxID=441950 RepID=A0ABQ6BFZ0_9BRAD|nr:hypothetical protein GCM10007857_77980 [Bradyrhizobium iriomotense]
MYDIAEREQIFGEIGAVLSGDAGDQSDTLSHAKNLVPNSISGSFASRWADTRDREAAPRPLFLGRIGRPGQPRQERRVSMELEAF